VRAGFSAHGGSAGDRGTTHRSAEQAKACGSETVLIAERALAPCAGVAYAPHVTTAEETIDEGVSGTGDSAGVESDAARRARGGVAYGLGAYIWWGAVPVYFKAVAHVNAFEVLAHRVIWSVVLLAVLMRIYGRLRYAVEAVRQRGTLLTLLGTTVLIAVNWFVFIWAVANDQLREASLGYFINPLVNVLLGFVVLRERLRAWQWVAVALAAAGVTWRTTMVGTLPVVALVLAGTFGLYGLMRKMARVDAMVGLMVETALLWPAALLYLIWLGLDGTLAFGNLSWKTSLLLSMGGIITAVPLLWFTNAARRLRLSTLGFLQYIAPTMQFLLAVLVYGEPFESAHAIGFGLIWVGLAIYSCESVVASRRQRMANVE